MKSILLVMASLLPPSFVAKAQDPAAGTSGPSSSIVRVNVTSQPFNVNLPWQKRQPSNRRGLGALMKDNRILVTAELVQDASYIELELAASGKKVTAEAETIDYESNLAIIKPSEDPDGFFNGLVALQLDSTPLKKGDKLEAWQFEDNGSPVTTEISFNKAEVGPYFLGASNFLTFEATGTVQYRSGSFTLPVVNKGKLTGMLMSYSSEEQTSQILPWPVIAKFFEDASDGVYQGFPSFGVKFSATLDQQLRSYLKLDKGEGGILITGVSPRTSASAAGLKPNDVILEVEGKKVDARGNYQDETWGLLSLAHLVRGSAKVDSELKMKIWRDGAALDVAFKLVRKNPQDFLIDPYMFDRGPKFLVQGGMVFQELTQTYLEGAGGGKEWRDRAPFKLVYALSNQEKYEKDRNKLVILSGILPSQSTIGYEGLRGMIVTKINGTPIKDIKDVDAAFGKPQEGLHKIEFDEAPYVVYLDAAMAEDDNKNLIPRRYRIQELKRLE